MYDEHMLLTHNDIDRVSIGSATDGPTTAPDGSLTIYPRNPPTSTPRTGCLLLHPARTHTGQDLRTATGLPSSGNGSVADVPAEQLTRRRPRQGPGKRSHARRRGSQQSCSRTRRWHACAAPGRSWSRREPLADRLIAHAPDVRHALRYGVSENVNMPMSR